MNKISIYLIAVLIVIFSNTSYAIGKDCGAGAGLSGAPGPDDLIINGPEAITNKIKTEAERRGILGIKGDGRVYSDNYIRQIIAATRDAHFDLSFTSMRFKNIELAGANINKSITIRNTAITENLQLPDVKTDSNIIIMDSSIAYANFYGTISSGKIGITNSKIDKLNLAMIDIKRSIDLSKSLIKKMLRIDQASVGGTVDLSQSCLEREIVLNKAIIGGDLFINKAVVDDIVQMENMHVAGEVNFYGSRFKKSVNLSGSIIDNNIFLAGWRQFDQKLYNGGVDQKCVSRYFATTTYDEPVRMAGIRVKGRLELSGGRFQSIDLSNGTVGQGLIFATMGNGSCARTDWSWQRLPDGLAGLNLQYFSTSVIGDHGDGIFHRDWPDLVETIGFNFQTSVGVDGAPDGLLSRNPESILSWLALDGRCSVPPRKGNGHFRHFSAGIYDLVGDLLTKTGRSDVAELVRFARWECQRSQSTWPAWIALSLAKVGIGYGIGMGYWRILGPVFVFTALGALILIFCPNSYTQESDQLTVPDDHAPSAWLSGLMGIARRRCRWAGVDAWANAVERNYRYCPGIFYSLDRLIPLISLSDLHGDVRIVNPIVRWYFFFHRTVGVVLAAYVAAGLALLR